MILILTGVCGCGKTTVGKALASKLGWLFIDADDYHSQANKQKMAEDTPLTDEDRKPWLESVHQRIQCWVQDGINGIVACSALKQSYRRILVNGNDEIPLQPISRDLLDIQSTEDVLQTGHIDAIPSSRCRDFLVVLLRGSYDILSMRLSRRQDHFMSPCLLQSQLDTLEEPTVDEQALVVDVNCDDVSMVVDSIISQLWLPK